MTLGHSPVVAKPELVAVCSALYALDRMQGCILTDDVVGDIYVEAAEMARRSAACCICTVDHAQCAVGAQAKSCTQLRAGLINNLLQAGDTPVLLLARPGQAAKGSYVSAFMPFCVYSSAMPQPTIPTDHAARGRLNGNRQIP